MSTADSSSISSPVIQFGDVEAANVALADRSRSEVIAAFARQEGDVGSPEVQIALLTKRIQELTLHFKANKHDQHSMRGMLRMISRRKKLLAYLRANHIDRYRAVLAALGLRK